jgi:hypothetical protein
MASASTATRIPKSTPDTSYGLAPSNPRPPSTALTPKVATKSEALAPGKKADR